MSICWFISYPLSTTLKLNNLNKFIIAVVSSSQVLLALPPVNFLELRQCHLIEDKFTDDGFSLAYNNIIFSV